MKNAPSAPSSVPTSPPAVSSTKKSPMSKKKKTFLIGGIVAGVLILLSGGSALAYNVWYQNPDKVVHDAIINAVAAETVSATGKLTVETDDFTMQLDVTSKSNLSEGAADITAKINAKEVDLSLELDGSGVVKDGAYYFKLDNATEVLEAYKKSGNDPMPPAADAIVKKIDGRWISVKPSDYKEISEAMAKQQTCLTDAVAKVQDDAAMRKEITDLYRANRIVAVKEKLGSQVINDTGSLGYKVQFDTDATEAVIRGMSDTEFGKSIKKCDSQIDFNKVADDFAKTFKESSKDAPEFTVELWVSRFGHEVTRFIVNGGDKEGVIDLVVDPVFNEDISVEEPSDAISIQELFEDIFRMMMTSQMELDDEGVEAVSTPDTEASLFL